MARKCPKGTICFENITFIFLFLFLIIIFLMYYIFNSKSNPSNSTNSSISQNTYIEESQNNNGNPYNLFGLFPRPSFSFSNIQDDVLMNPYTPPLKDTTIFKVGGDVRGAVPINVSTRSVDVNYRQVGILKKMNASDKNALLPLMGRPLFVSRDKWQYYTISDQNNQIKLPVSFKSKSCTNEYGCDEINNGDTVYVDGIDSAYHVTLYENDTLRYLPFV
jgi:hypothetical protein